MNYKIESQEGVVFRGDLTQCKNFIKDLHDDWVKGETNATLYSKRGNLLQTLEIIKDE